MSSILSAELSATCNALGTFDKKSGKYLIDDYTLNTVKDLIRYLRRDGEEHEIRRHFGQTKVLQTDLLPMLVDHWENTQLFDVTLRLLVNLTNPALLLYREEVPAERSARHNYLQILTHLQAYKEEAFTKLDTWNVFAKKLAKILEIDWSERDEDTGLVIERILILIRNVLHVPADLDQERRPENDASVHDQVLWALNQSGMLDIILYMSSENEKQYFMHILEIISHLLREQNPTSLAASELQRSVHEKLRDEQELLSIRSAENKQRINKVRQFSGTRHSRFGGTYVIQNMKSISDNEMICLKPLNSITKLDFGGNKKDKLVKPKNRRPVESGVMERRSAFAIRLFLREFCVEFLNSAYNAVSRSARAALGGGGGGGGGAQPHDETYYLWAVRFFMEFNRASGGSVALVSETLSVPMFHFVQQQMEKYYDMMKVEKKKFASWSRRLHLALLAYRELLQSVSAMRRSEELAVAESARVIQTNVFYVLEYREFVLSMLLNYDECKMPKSYLVDLMETVHLFLKMLEHFCKKTGLVVQKKVRTKTKSKKSKAAPPATSRSAQPQPRTVEWEQIRPQLAAVLSSGLAEYPPPFDAASDVPIDDQREQCVRRIQRAMRQMNYEEAVGTLRAAREVWPSEGMFGAAGIAEHDELDMLQTIYRADLGLATSDPPHEQTAVTEETRDDSYDDEEEEEPEKTTTIVESDFDFQEFIGRFCHPRVIAACVCVLQHTTHTHTHTLEQSATHTHTQRQSATHTHTQRQSATHTHTQRQSATHTHTQRQSATHAATRLLHRCVESKRHALLYQASLFRVFQRVLSEPRPDCEELRKFAVYVMRQFTRDATRSRKVFIELLFYKSVADAAQIQHGYDQYDQDDKRSRGSAWSEEQEEELRRLYMENQQSPQTDQDVIDWILDNLIERSRTRRGVIAKLKELGLIFRAPTKKTHRQNTQKQFTSEDDDMLKMFWEQYGKSDDPISEISSRMPHAVPRRAYVERLMFLGLVRDRNDCRNKRNRNSGGEGAGRGDDKSSQSESDSDSDSSSGNKRQAHKQSHKRAGSKLTGSKLSGSKHTGSKLTGSKLTGSKLSGSKLTGSKLTGSKGASGEVTASAREVAQILIKAVDSGLSEPLRWLCSCLEEVSLDQEAEGYSPAAPHTPLVPLEGAAVSAVEDHLFRDVLRAVGLLPPADQQEIYWRIPSSLHFETIRKRREIILKAINKELVVDSDNTLADKRQASGEQLPLENNNNADSSDDEDLFDNLRKLRENNEPLTNKSSARKRSRTPDTEHTNKKGKMQKINEDGERNNDEQSDDDDDDILKFARNTLQRADDAETLEEETTDVPENVLASLTSDESDKEDEITLTSSRNKKKRRAVIDDDSD